MLYTQDSANCQQMKRIFHVEYFIIEIAIPKYNRESNIKECDFDFYYELGISFERPSWSVIYKSILDGFRRFVSQEYFQKVWRLKEKIIRILLRK